MYYNMIRRKQTNKSDFSFYSILEKVKKKLIPFYD